MSGSVLQRAQPPRTSVRTAGETPEEGGDDVKSSWPSWAGRHTCYRGEVNGRRPRRRARCPNPRRGSECPLQPAGRKAESRVIAQQRGAVNLYPGLVHTARHTRGPAGARSAGAAPHLPPGGGARPARRCPRGPG
eukprot:scaffold3862_cov2921-Pavlova_lutheri.AAC.4